MSDEVNVLSRTQIVIVEPVSKSVAVINAGPAGPSGSGGGPPGPPGSPGAPGKTWLGGDGAPSAGLGANGDFYLDKTASAYYGPKVGGSWGASTSLAGPAGLQGQQGQTGLTGQAGTNGTNGTNGVDGRTWLSGDGAPSAGLGANGDFYMDTTNDAYYGPKAAGAWGSATSIIGPAGTGTGDISSHILATTTKEHEARAVRTQAWDATIPDTPENFNAGSDPAMADELAWAADTDIEVIIRNLASTAAFESWIRTIHIEKTNNVHGLPAPAGQLLYKFTNGVVPIIAATTVPVAGSNPPAGTFWLYSDAGKAIIHDSSGDRVQLSQPWKDEFAVLAADDAGSSSTVKRTLLTPNNNLAINAIYEVSGYIRYTALADATNGCIIYTWALPAGSVIDWSAFGLASTATSSQGSLQAKSTNGSGNIFNGGAGTATVGTKIEGTLVTGATAGKPILEYSANGIPGTPTIARSRSRLRFVRVG